MANDPMQRCPYRQKAPVTQWVRARAYSDLRHGRLFLVGRASMPTVSCWTCVNADRFLLDVRQCRPFLVARASMPTVSCCTCVNADRFLLDVRQCRPFLVGRASVPTVSCWTCINAVRLFLAGRTSMPAACSFIGRGSMQRICLTLDVRQCCSYRHS